MSKQERDYLFQFLSSESQIVKWPSATLAFLQGLKEHCDKQDEKDSIEKLEQ